MIRKVNTVPHFAFSLSIFLGKLAVIHSTLVNKRVNAGKGYECFHSKCLYHYDALTSNPTKTIRYAVQRILYLLEFVRQLSFHEYVYELSVVSRLKYMI